MTRHRFHWLMFGFLLSLAFVADAKAMYAPSIGRFLSRDPIEFEGSQWNFYEIANSRIHTGLDPSGMCEVEKCKDQEKTKDLPACPEKSRDDYLNDFYKDKKKKLGIENTKLEVKAHCKKEDLKDKDKCKPGGGKHYNFYSKPWKDIENDPKKEDYFVGSLVCCKCCKDTDKGPRTTDGDDGGDCSGNSKHQ